MNKIKKKFNFSDFLPHVLGMLLFFNGFFHIIVSIFLVFGIDTTIMSLLDGISFSKHSVRYAGITSGIIIGVWQFFNAVGIYKRKKKAVYSTILIVFLSSIKYTIFNSFPQMVFLNLFFLVFMILTWRFFEKDTSQRMKNYQELVAWLTVVLALIYGICGSYMLRDHYDGINTIMDAVYYTIITYSTVGYGDIIPKTTEAKIFTITMVLIGLGSFAATITFIIGPKIESKVKGIFNIMGNLSSMKDHVIICGFSDLAKAIVKHLKLQDIPYVIIDNSLEAVTTQQEDTYIIFKGLISSVKTFEEVNIKKAKAVITVFDRDPENILATLTIKEALETVKHPENVKIITRIENENNIEKARKIGVHEIISPSSMAAKSILGIL